MTSCTFVSLNVRGLGDRTKRHAVFKWLEKHRYDVVFLQETHTTASVETVWNKEWKGASFFSHGSSSSRGCCILIRNGVDFKVQTVVADNDGRYILLRCFINDDYFSLVNVYCPNPEKDQVLFLDKLNLLFTQHSISVLDDVILGGDWNFVKDPYLDKSGGNYITKQNSLSKLNNLMSKLNISDVWRIKSPNSKRYSWRQSNPLVQCRLDFFLVSDSLYDNIVNCDIIPSIRTDHSAVVLSLEKIQNSIKGPSLWKFNTSLLLDTEYTSQLKVNIIKWNNEYDMEDARVKWELLKYEIRNFTIGYSKQKRKNINIHQRKLEIELLELERNLTPTNHERYNVIKNELKEIENNKIAGSILRSKVEWYEQGEKSSKYFLGLEKSRAISKHVRKLQLDNGIEITDPKIIMQKQVEYFTDLYSSTYRKNVNFEELFSQVPKLNDTEREKCEGIISVAECETILKTFSNGKSPGNDGIPPEFYKYFWHEINIPLINCFNYSFEHGELSSSQKQSVITLIQKKDKDRLKIDNWRPISLLNVDYKILSKVLTNRLHDVVPQLVDITQSGYVKERLMGDSVRTIIDTIEHCQINNEHGIMMMVDFTKAFDSLEWPFLFRTLKHMNFGDSFLKWINVLYKNVESCILNYGTTSKYFRLSRGVRQGDPLSAYLFILCMEVLSRNVVNNNNIKGISINNRDYKLIQYADDLTAILKDKNSVIAFLSELDRFKVSGLKINTSKTSALLLGNMPTFMMPANIKWNSKPIKVLGIYIGYNLSDCFDLTIRESIAKMKQTLNSWKLRKLTLNGKVLILKSLIISKFTHLANLIPISDDVIKEIDQLIFEYLWNGKTHKLKKRVVIQDFKFGGFKMIDLRAMIIVQKLKWIKLYLNGHNCLWRNLMESLIKVKNLTFFLLGNFDMSRNWTQSLFYHNILSLLFEINKHNMLYSLDNILSQRLFYNRYIRFDNNLIYDQNLMNAGLWTVSDLFDSRNKPITFDKLQKRGILGDKYLIWRNIILQINKYKPDFTLQSDTACKLILQLPDSDRIDILTSNTKSIYSNLICINKLVPPAVNKYKIMFPEIDDLNTSNLFLIPRVCTRSNYIKDFQFQILHRYLPTNHLLYKMNKIGSMSCTFCNIHCETITHLFYECTCVKSLWMFIDNVIELTENVKTNLKCQDVLFGLGFQSKICFKYKDINNLILHAKDFIWRCRKYNRQVSRLEFVSWLGTCIAYDSSLDKFYVHMNAVSL